VKRPIQGLVEQGGEGYRWETQKHGMSLQGRAETATGKLQREILVNRNPIGTKVRRSIESSGVNPSSEYHQFSNTIDEVAKIPSIGPLKLKRFKKIETVPQDF
jgi:hypothetical protein